MVGQIPPNRLKDAVLFSLAKFGEPIRRDILIDGSIVVEFGLSTGPAVKLSNDLAFERDVLFSAFQRLADGEELGPVAIQDGSVFGGRIYLEENGTGIVESETERFSFKGAALFSKLPERRLKMLDALLQSRSLHIPKINEIRALVAGTAFDFATFLDVMRVLESAPESWGEDLTENLRRSNGDLKASDIIPENDAYWANLIPPIQHSTTLTEYIEGELKREWLARLSGNQETAIRSIALAFAAPELVPTYLLEGRRNEDVEAILAAGAGLPDPYGQVGIYELCRSIALERPAIEAIGGRALAGLARDPDGLTYRCRVLTAIFLITAAHLAEHEEFGRSPVFWRRLAAFAHAALVLRSIGTPAEQEDRLGPWASSFAGDAYLMSGFRDSVDEPRWRPEWIADNYLAADVMGRIVPPLTGVGPPHPESWNSDIELVSHWFDDPKRRLLGAFPNVLQGGMKASNLSLDGDDPVTLSFRAFIETPSSDTLLDLAPFIFTFGYPADAGASVARVVRELTDRTMAENEVEMCLIVASYIATVNKDLDLGNIIADTSFKLVLRAESRAWVREGVCRLLEASAADRDRDRGSETLIRRLENLGFALKSQEACRELEGLLRTLQRVDRALAPKLQRAVAAAGLGAHQG
jgi:hypothetical protein